MGALILVKEYAGCVCGVFLEEIRSGPGKADCPPLSDGPHPIHGRPKRITG